MSLQSLTNIGFGGSGGADNVPKVLAELQGLTFSYITGAAANTSMPVAGMEPEDTLKSVYNLTDLTEADITHCTINDRRATGTITILTTLVNLDTVTVNGKVYTFREQVESIASNLAPNVVPITVLPSGVVVATVAARLAQIIMSNDSTLVCTAALGVVTIKDRVAGTAGNSKTLVTSSGHATVSAATLAGGAAVGAANGFKCSDSLAAKKLQVIWYNKTP